MMLVIVCVGFSCTMVARIIGVCLDQQMQAKRLPQARAYPVESIPVVSSEVVVQTIIEENET